LTGRRYREHLIRAAQENALPGAAELRRASHLLSALTLDGQRRSVEPLTIASVILSDPTLVSIVSIHK
jgi:hypothetical protein